MLYPHARTFFLLENLDHQFRRLVGPVSGEDDPAVDLVFVVAPLRHCVEVKPGEYFLRVERRGLGDAVTKAVPLGERQRMPCRLRAEARVAMR